MNVRYRGKEAAAQAVACGDPLAFIRDLGGGGIVMGGLAVQISHPGLGFTGGLHRDVAVWRMAFGARKPLMP